MCGIAGKIYFDVDQIVTSTELKSMINLLIHRGPDDEGFYINKNVGLGFRRLSIIDIQKGHQPLSNHSKKIWITFNGEIYNFRELRIELEKKGYKFNTNTDTEVIVNLYEEYGENCLVYLRGMFAFVIWDDNQKLLFAARDRFGIKPFHYYMDEEKFIWGSELKSITASDNIKMNIDLNALDSYLTYGYITGSKSIYKEIKKLDPGHYIILSPYQEKKITIKNYWHLEFNPDYTKKEEEWVEKLEYLLKESVKMRLISDVPLGAFLSGGIDSSSVVALMSIISGQPVKTFSIGFKEEKYNELEYARLIAKKYNTDHHELIIEPESINLLPELVKIYDEPFADSSAIPTYYVSKFTREYVTVALSGDGGDELFAGYNRYSQMLKIFNSQKKLPAISINFYKALFNFIPSNLKGKGMSYSYSLPVSNLFGFWREYSSLIKNYEKEKLYTEEFKNTLYNNHQENSNDRIENKIKSQNEFINHMQKQDIDHYLVDDILTKVDRASMKNSLEVRVPFLDHKLAELAVRIPPHLKINSTGKKMILKNVMEKYISEKVINHPKKGFSVPLPIWFKNDFNEYVHDILLSPKTQLNPFFKRQEIDKIIKKHKYGNRNFSNKLWSLLFLETWLQDHYSIKS